MAIPRQAPVPTAKGLLPRLFAGVFGAFLGLTLLKFGNPPIFEKLVSAPGNVFEFALNTPWPIIWAYWLLVLVALLGLLVLRFRPEAPLGLVVLPLLWLIWEGIAGIRSVDPQLTRPTLKHFTAAALCFYLGFFCLRSMPSAAFPPGGIRRGQGRAGSDTGAPSLGWFWIGLVCSFLIVLAVGWEQHFGGLEETRNYFFTYLYPQMKEVSPEYLKKISSDRIFSTLFYPNTLAGAVLLFLPATLAVIAQLRERLTLGARAFVAFAVVAGALGCLYWSGSKGGWLLILVLGLIAATRLRLSQQIKIGLAAAVLVIGVAGFAWKYRAFFQKGATSVVARFDYWGAAVKTTAASPIFGTGPGTFFVAYQRLKRPESEPARLVHNDYLEQASDSGLPGAVLYAVFIVGVLWKSRPAWEGGDWEAFAIWLGLLGWALQGFFEFGLYIPALAWPAFTFMGWLLSQKRAD